jgi:hypothetical protein
VNGRFAPDEGLLAILFGKARILNRYESKTRTPTQLRKLKPGDIEQLGNSEKEFWIRTAVRSKTDGQLCPGQAAAQS